MAFVPRPIRLLPDQIVNQIAAGEVIERPASIVKELLENSLDSGARRIDIDITGGGIDSITVNDDGCGIKREDLSLALARHCTSKLVQADDLAAITTLGFRGEALASIAAVARVRLLSCVAEAESGYKISLAGGNGQLDPVPVAHPVGTTVHVADLFFNTSPRRRFLKRAKTEFLHIQQLVRQIGFARPELQLALQHDGRRILTVQPATDEVRLLRRIEVLFSKAFVQNAVAISEVLGDLRIKGWIGLPSTARSQTDMQFLVVNGRVVHDRRVLHALRMAYENSIAPGRHPCFALSLELPPQQVDVNVHPTKAEVRFREARQVHDTIFATSRRALSPQSNIDVRHEQASSVPQIERSVAESVPVYKGARHGLPDRRVDRSHGSIQMVDNRWIIAADGNRLSITDARAAAYSLTCELLSSASSENVLASRPLLVPEPVQLDPDCRFAVERLVRYGFTLDPIGPARFVLRTVPVRLLAIDTPALVVALTDLLSAEMSDAALVQALAHCVAQAWLVPDNQASIQVFLASIADLDVVSASLDSTALERVLKQYAGH